MAFPLINKFKLLLNRKKVPPKFCQDCKECKMLIDEFTGKRISNYCRIYKKFVKKCQKKQIRFNETSKVDLVSYEYN